MNADQINPFIQATHQVFETMLQCTPRRGELRLAGNENPEIIRTAIIGLSGTVRGAVALSFPASTSLNATRRLMQTDGDVSDEELSDALGEIANMIAGCAKAKLEGQDVSIGLPTVVKGQKYCLEHPKDSLTLSVPFNSDLGTFTLNVTFSTMNGSGG